MPRSSIYKTGYMMANSEGIIDRTYRGVLKAPVVLVSKTENPGMWAGNRYFQIVAPDLGWIYAVRIVDALPSTERGDGGFGSTGK
jgi:dUTP pyrophosphatase